MSENFNINQIIMTGFDHKQSTIELREKVYFTRNNTEKAYEKLKNNLEITEAVILSTCNRSETYATVKNYEIGKETLLNFYAEFFNLSKSEIEKFIIFRSGENAVKHLFEVASGFQSLVLGEDQIIGQAKDSYETALKYSLTGKILNRLFINAITTAKKIKSTAGMSGTDASISSIGVKLIEKELNDFSKKSVLVIGLGEMSKIVIQNLIKKNVQNIFVTNRTKRKVEDFAKDFPGIIEIDFDDRYKTIEEVHAIISCTAAPHYVIRKEKFLQYYKNQPVIILDLAVPRDIEPSISELSPVKLYRLDDLDKTARENAAKRLHLMQKGKDIIEQDITKYFNWLNERKAINLILTVRDYSNRIIAKKLEELDNSLHDIDEKQQVLIRKEFHNYKNTFIHQSTVKIKELISEKQPPEEILKNFLNNAEIIK